MYKMNSPKVVSNEVGGEVIVINLDSGLYFSLNGTAAVIWEAVSHGMDTAEMKKSLQEAGHPFGSDDDETIASFVRGLVTEELLIPGDETCHDTFDPEKLKGITEAPEFEKFADMQDLLLLDPIHEVADVGWPVKK